MSKIKNEQKLGLATMAIHGHDPNSFTNKPTILPIIMSSNFKYDRMDPVDGFYYTRCGNPTRNCLETTIAKLESADYALTFASGMSTMVSVVQLLKTGDHIICSNIIYGGVSHYLSTYAPKWGLDITYVDPNESKNFAKAIKKNTKLIWLEALTNPTLQLADVSGIRKQIENRPDIILAVDNTFLTPCLFNALDNGADIVMNSMTKFLNGHGDVLMGCLATRNEDIYKHLKDVQKSIGSLPSPFDSYLVNRSLKTLRIRMKEHCSNALIIAQFLESHPGIEKVVYPGLKSHPQHELAKKSLKSGFGGMVSFYLKGNRDTTEKFVMSLKVIVYSGSLGMAESIMCYPWTISHRQLTSDEKAAIGITETFLRMSVGLEDAQDLVQDLQQALAKAK